MGCTYRNAAMHKLSVILAAFTLMTGAMPLASASAADQRTEQRGDQASARAEMKAGRNMPIGEIERRIVRRMGAAEYLGFEYDRAAGAYRLKFIENGRVIWVDVDAKTANILRIAR